MVHVETLIVSDLDGTLWYDGEECHPNSLKSINYLRSNGIPLVIATGRRLRIVAAAFEKMDLLQPCILLNGSLGYDFEIKKSFFQRGFSPIAERKILQTIGGDCETAIGGLAKITNNNLILKAQLFSDEGDESFDYKFTGRDVDAANIGKTVGEKLLNLAGKKFKRR